MNKIVLGLVGEIAAGKDTVAAYLKKKYKSQTVSFSQPLRDILNRLYLPINRKNMDDLGMNLRQVFGQDLLSRVIYDEVRQTKSKLVVLPNIRLESDMVYLKTLPEFHLVGIDCEIKTRFARLKNRRQNIDDKTKTWRQFLSDSRVPLQQQIRQIAKRAKFQLDNNGTKRELFQQVEQLMKNIKK
ncbi:MAG: AAA family ATPase [Patescibacteria group bacterium]|jgi:dephospho-CoA kinase